LLELESSIELGAVRGRIDHLAFDERRTRVYVAERGNDSVGVVDLQGRRVVARISGLSHPQGIAYDSPTDTLYVANGGDGSLRLFRGADLTPVARIEIGEDADNVRIDPGRRLVYAGYGEGALAVVEAFTRRKVGDIPLAGHPEGFQIAPVDPYVYVNVADARQIAVLDLRTRQQRATWSLAGVAANFPLLLDDTGQRVLTITRAPPALIVFDANTGSRLSTIDTCGDADDAALDARRRRVYVVCGEGFVDAFASSAGGYVPITRVRTARGARTGLFIPRLDLLLVAAPAADGRAAQLWLLRPHNSVTGRRSD
jgi:YVTN family beta-propeller protein